MSDDTFLKDILERAYNTKDELKVETLYKNAQRKASKGNRKAIKNYQNKILDAYFTHLTREDKTEFKDIFNFDNFNYTLDEILQKTKKQEIEKIYILNSIQNDIHINSYYEYVISVMCLFADNKYTNAIRNRIFSTKAWLDDLGESTDVYDNLIKTLDEIIKAKKLSEYNTKEIYDFYEKDERKKYLYENYNLDSTENAYNCLKYCLKNDIDYCDELIRKNIANENISKDEFQKYVLNCTDFDNSKNNGKVTNKGDNGRCIGIINRIIKVLRPEILRKSNEYEEFRVLNVKYSETIDCIKQQNKSFNFEGVYTQGKDGNVTNIFKRNMFNNITKNTFDNIWGIYRNDFKFEKIKDDIEDDVRITDEILSKFIDEVRGKSGKYKKYYSNKVNNIAVFKEIAEIDIGEFDIKYKSVSKYKCQKDKIEFNNISKVNHYLTEINYKLAMQIFRLERDLHNIIVGYYKIVHNEDILKNVNDDISIAYSKNNNDMHYNVNVNYDNYIKFIKFLGLDIEAELVDKKGTENIRNYIAHFYIVREPFNEKLIDKIKHIDNILSYRKRYQNSTITSVLEVFKGDVSLNYDEIKKFNMQKVNNLETNFPKLYDNKKITVLDLDHYNTEYNKTVIDKLLFSKVNNSGNN